MCIFHLVFLYDTASVFGKRCIQNLVSIGEWFFRENRDLSVYNNSIEQFAKQNPTFGSQTKFGKRRTNKTGAIFSLVCPTPTKSVASTMCGFFIKSTTERIGFQWAGLNLYGLFSCSCYRTKLDKSIHVLQIALVLWNMMSLFFLALCTSHLEFAEFFVCACVCCSFFV